MRVRPGFEKETLDQIRFLVSRGYEVRGHGYRFFSHNGWFCFEPI